MYHRWIGRKGVYISLIFTPLMASIAYPAATDQTVSYTYHGAGSNGAGLIATMDGPRSGSGDTSSYAYDASGNLSVTTNPLGHTIQLSDYTARRLPGKVTDANGVETLLSYHLRGWLESIVVKDPGGNSSSDAITVLAYSPVGQITRMTLPDSSYLNFEYDDARRLVAIENNLFERIEFTLDASGNRTQEVIKNGGGTIVKTQTRVFNTLNQLVRSIGASGQTTAYGYDNNGNTSNVTDARLNPSAFAFDALNRLVSQTDPEMFDVLYSYNSQGRIQSVTDQRGLVTTYGYDAFGNLTSLQSPDTGSSIYDYDSAGNRIQQIDARGVVTNYTYDDLNRLLTVTYPGSPAENISYSYDSVANGNFGVSRLTSITDESGQIDFTYDHRGNVIAKSYSIETINYSLGYSYDVGDNLTQVSYPSGRTVDYSRDGSGRVSGITTKENAGAPTVTVISNVAYLPFGPIMDYSYGNGLTQSLAHDQDYLVTNIGTAGTSSIVDLHYGYDFNSNITALDDLDNIANDQSFGYDTLNRLEQGIGNYGQLDYQYDGLGNRVQKTIDDGVITTRASVYASASNQLGQVNIDNGTTQTQRVLGYDANGNVVLDVRASGDVYDLGYNHANRYSVVTKNASPRAAYLYNALGQRTAKFAIGTNTNINDHYHYDKNGLLLGISTETGAIKREYIYLQGMKVASLIDDAYTNEVLDVPVVVGNPPTADAGPDIVALAGATVQLDGAGSFDPDGPITYQWVGSDLSDPTLVNPTLITQDSGSNENRTYTLTVTDGGGLTDSDSVSVTLYSMSADSDMDALPDGWEFIHFGDIQTYSGIDDPDADGISNEDEYLQGTDPNVPDATDSDGDGVPDGSDNCPNDPNPNQTDSDADTVGNVCDLEQITVESIAADDGWVKESRENSNSGNKTNNQNNGSKALRVGDDRKDKQYKAIISFDLASIPIGGIIDSMSLQLRRNNRSLVGSTAGFGNANLVLKTGSFNNSAALEGADFQATATESYVGSLVDGLTATASVNATGIAAIQSAHSAGTSKLQLRLEYALDDNDDKGNDYIGYYSSDNNTSSNHPQLTINYTLAD